MAENTALETFSVPGGINVSQHGQPKANLYSYPDATARLGNNFGFLIPTGLGAIVDTGCAVKETFGFKQSIPNFNPGKFTNACDLMGYGYDAVWLATSTAPRILSSVLSPCETAKYISENKLAWVADSLGEVSTLLSLPKALHQSGAYDLKKSIDIISILKSSTGALSCFLGVFVDYNGLKDIDNKVYGTSAKARDLYKIQKWAKRCDILSKAALGTLYVVSLIATVAKKYFKVHAYVFSAACTAFCLTWTVSHFVNDRANYKKAKFGLEDYSKATPSW